MVMQTQTSTGPDQDRTAEEKIQQLRDLFADAPELGRKALDNVIEELTAQATQPPPEALESAGRAGVRIGQVSELTILVPFAPESRTIISLEPRAATKTRSPSGSPCSATGSTPAVTVSTRLRRWLATETRNERTSVAPAAAVQT